MLMYNLIDFIFPIMFILVFIIIFINIIKGLSIWNKNNNSPRLTVDATVVTKRTSVSHHSHANTGNIGIQSSTSTSYYATFQVESGDRLELSVSGTEYGMITEGDYGKLTFQGTRYINFERKIF